MAKKDKKLDSDKIGMPSKGGGKPGSAIAA